MPKDREGTQPCAKGEFIDERGSRLLASVGSSSYRYNVEEVDGGTRGTRHPCGAVGGTSSPLSRALLERPGVDLDVYKRIFIPPFLGGSAHSN
jgi:hypothetical protein